MKVVKSSNFAKLLTAVSFAGAALLARQQPWARAATPSVPAPASDCAAYTGLPAGFPQAPHAGMVRIPAGQFEPGSVGGYPDEQPAGPVKVGAFWMDRTEVTNAQFAAFVRATGYVTEAEKQGGAAVFQAPARNAAIEPNSWWSYVKGADWRHPEGPRSNLRGRDNQPVVQVTRADAVAYSKWLGHDLPTEAEWEWAARGGGSAEQVEREPRSADGHPTANYWQGFFPYANTKEDGYVSAAPVACFAANGYGVHDLIGNVWELTRDPYTGPRQPHADGDPSLVRPAHADAQFYVIKGGSFLCSADYCMRYRAAARHPQERDLGVSHVGFRTMARG